MHRAAYFLLAALLLAVPPACAANDPLPSWNDSAAKTAIVDFVGKVTKEGGPDCVPVPDRIATFDNDGTLRAEQPIYFQFAFAIDRVAALAPEHPDWKEKQPFKGILKGDLEAALATGEKASSNYWARRTPGSSRKSSARSSMAGLPAPSIPRPTGPTPTWSTSRCSSC